MSDLVQIAVASFTALTGYTLNDIKTDATVNQLFVNFTAAAVASAG